MIQRRFDSRGMLLLTICASFGFSPALSMSQSQQAKWLRAKQELIVNTSESIVFKPKHEDTAYTTTRVRRWIRAASNEAGVTKGNVTIEKLDKIYRDKKNYPKLHVVVALSEKHAPERYASMLIQAKMHNLELHSIPWATKFKYDTKASLTRSVLHNLIKKAEKIDIPDDDIILFTQDDTIFYRDFRHELQNSVDSLPHYWNMFHLCPFLITFGQEAFDESYDTDNIAAVPFRPNLQDRYEETQHGRRKGRFYDSKVIDFMKNDGYQFLGDPVSFVLKKGYLPKFKKSATEEKWDTYDITDDVILSHINEKSHYVARDPLLCVAGGFGGAMKGMIQNHYWPYKDTKSTKAEGSTEFVLEKFLGNNPQFSKYDVDNK